MNLQVCMPYEPCKYACPFCISKGHKHGYDFKNLHKENRNEYLVKLQDTIEMYNIKTVVITGEADPSQNMLWLQDCVEAINALSPKRNIKIELQTKNQKADYSLLKGLDVLAISISSPKEFQSAKELVKKYPNFIIRPTIVLSSKFNGHINYEELDLTPFKQVTFKEMQYTEDEATNEWIYTHPFVGRDDLKNLIFSYKKNISIFYDMDCQNAVGRYLIYRSDGNTYRRWEDLPK
jgi:organic radical activating enzyme